VKTEGQEEVIYEEVEEVESEADGKEAIKKAICGKPKFFTGKAPREIGQAAKWLTTLERYLEAQNLKDDESKILVASTYLEEDASEWFESNKHGIKSVAGFKKLFLATYEAVNVQETALVGFHNIQQGVMSVEEYLAKFNSMVNWLPQLDPQMKLNKFISGLHPRIRDHLFENKLTGDFCDAVAAALRKDQYSYARRSTVKTPDAGGANSWGRRAGVRNEGKTGCWNCGLPGHIRRDCQKPQNKPQDKRLWEKKQLALVDNISEAEEKQEN